MATAGKQASHPGMFYLTGRSLKRLGVLQKGDAAWLRHLETN